jgi:hypothetical protein
VLRVLAGELRRTKRLDARSAVLLVAAAAVVVEIWVAVGPTDTVARIGYRSFRTPTPLVRDADIDPLAVFVPKTSALVQARETIPPDATYTIVVGDSIHDPGLLKLVFRFWLLPRQYARTLAAAQWVIAYERPSESLGVRYSQEIGLAPDVNVVKVKR